MFGRMLFRYWLMVLLMGVTVGLLVVSSDSDDQVQYRALIESSKSSAEEGSIQKALASQQRREGMQKSIWYTKGNERLKMFMLSEAATLRVRKQSGTSGVVEEMEQLRCWVQEKLLPQSKEQLVRYFEAQTATYSYDHSTLNTDEIRIIAFRAPGDLLPAQAKENSISIRGVADKAKLHLAGDSFEMEAEHLHASFFNQGPTGEIHADRALYTEHKLELIGGVRFDRKAGRITCDRAELVPKGGQSLSEMDAHGHVVLSLPEKGTLHCDHAHFDVEGESALFDSPTPGRLVEFNTRRRTASGKEIPLVISAEQIAIETSPGADQPDLRMLEARGSVSLLYDQVNRVEGDYAKYFLDAKGKTETITLLPSEISPCQVRDAQGNQIVASRIDVSMEQERVRFTDPVGDFFRISEDGNSERLHFVADNLTWKIPQNMLHLEGKIVLTQVGSGELHNDHSLILAYSEDEGQRELRWVEAQGRTQLIYQGMGPEQPKVLTCWGQARIDNIRRLITLDRPEHSIARGREFQVQLTDRAGSIQADHVKVNYIQGDDGAMAIQQVELTGNVLVVNSAPLNPADTRPVHQFAVADKLIYLPIEGKMELHGQGSARVLYYDQINQIRMSAPAILIQRDQLTQSDSVRGVGDVRLTFLQPEMERFSEMLSGNKRTAENAHDSSRTR